MSLVLTSQQLNMIKELQRDPFCSETRALTHFINVCAKYNVNPQKVADALADGYQDTAKEKLNGK